MKRNYTKGFTLIELLVVIAIIGILSAVVLASLNSARAKGGDAAVKSDLSSVRDQAEIYYDNQTPNSYGAAFAAAACPAVAGTMFYDDVQTRNAIINAATAGGSTVAAGTLCATDGTNYAVISKLKTANYWCIDSTGVAKSEGSLALSGVACP